MVYIFVCIMQLFASKTSYERIYAFLEGVCKFGTLEVIAS